MKKIKKISFVIVYLLLVDGILSAKEIHTIMQWNIGHFSGEKYLYSTIDDNNYNQRLTDFL